MITEQRSVDVVHQRWIERPRQREEGFCQKLRTRDPLFRGEAMSLRQRDHDLQRAGRQKRETLDRLEREADEREVDIPTAKRLEVLRSRPGHDVKLDVGQPFPEPFDEIPGEGWRPAELVLGEWAEREQFRDCPYLNTLVEVRDPDHPAYREIGSYIDEVEAYLSGTVLEAGIPDAPIMGRQLRFLAMGTWLSIVFEASTRPAVTARAMAGALLAARMETTPDDVERRATAR